jgi:iron complex transport system substrate-binding protein
VIVDIMQPEVIVGFGSSNNPFDLLQKKRLKICGDWTSPLGKAEWIKFFGFIYGLDKEFRI